MKDVGLRIRVQRELRERFLEVCRAQDIPAAQVLREFMRDYVHEHGEAEPESSKEVASEASTSAVKKLKPGLPHG